MLETDINYGNNYSDYKDIYKNQVQNPNKIIKLTKEEEEKLKEKLKNKRKNIKKASNYLYENEDEDHTEDKSGRNNFNKEQNKLYKKNLKYLIKEQENDKKIIINSKIYDNHLIKDAENQTLDMSPSLLRALDEHYKFKRLT